MTGSSPLLELRGIDKRFGPVHANRSVDLSLHAREVLGLLGENGAGKTTLMNVLFGIYRADAGEIRVEGRPVVIRARPTRWPRASAWCISTSTWSTGTACSRT